MKEIFEKNASTHRSIDTKAALELARTNPILRDDEYTFQAIKKGGYINKDGEFEQITDLGNFLAEREEAVKTKIKGGPEVKAEHLIQHSDPKEKVE